MHKNDISTIQLINGKNAEKILYQREVSSSSKNMRLIHLGPKEYLFLYGMEVLHIKDLAVVWQSPKPFSKFSPCFKQMEDGTIFISHNNGKGVRKYKNLEAVKNEEYEVWLDDIIISDVFIERNGVYWFTTIGNGVYYVPSLSIKVFDEESGLKSSNISTFAIKDPNSIFFVDQEGNFYLLNHHRDQIQALPKSGQDVPIISLFYDPTTNILWSGAPPLKFFEEKEWKDLITDSDRNRSIKGTLIKINPSADYKSLWGGGSFGFASIDLNNNRLSILSSEMEGLKRTRTFFVYENSKQQTFISNLNGFFELKNNQLIPINEDKPSFQLRIEDIKEDQNRNLILGTKGAGVLVWSENNVVKIGKKDGLLSNMIEHLEIDDHNNIWVATLNGLNLINRQNRIEGGFNIVSYTKAHGLPSNEINFLKSQGDTLWLATPKGLVLFPKEQQFSCQNQQVFLENFIVNDKIIKEGNKLKYDENNIRIEYLSINSKLQGNIEYKYRLNNRLAWQYTQERAANLIDLSPGLYQFEVQAKDENGEWTPSLVVKFLIKQPFWERAWFITIGILAILGFIWLAVQRYIARIKRDNEIEREMQSLKASALQAQMNPHFVFNCLNAIQSFIAGKESEKATRYLAKFAMLVRNNLNASVNKVVSLEEEIQTIENYLSFEKMRFQRKLNYSIIVDPSLNIYDLEIPPLLTLTYVENAVIHGLLQTPRQGEIEIKYLNQGDDIAIEIIDNGLGIFQTQKMKKKNQLEGIHKSIGMSISKKMLEIFNERSSKEDLLIEELKNDLGKIQGTRIMLKIKIRYRTFDS